MEVFKQEFVDWRNSKITQLFRQEAEEAVVNYTLAMVGRRESNPADDQYIKGFLQGIQALMDWIPEFVQTEESTDAED